MSKVAAYKLRAVPVIYGWKYTGQPRSKWPVWLRNHYSGQFSGDISRQIGRIACAHDENGRRVFWRWFDINHFDRVYEPAEAQP